MLKLREAIQSLCQSSNPLARSMDYLQVPSQYVYICVYTCVYIASERVSLYAYFFVCTHTHTHTHTHPYTHQHITCISNPLARSTDSWQVPAICVCVHMCVCAYIYIYTLAHTHTHTHTHTHIYRRI